MFRKVLIANRGEIAVRIARTLRDMAILPVAVYTDADRSACHVQSAAEAHPLGPEARAYLDIEHIVGIAHASGCDALHPGYGFLSENPEFAEACARASLTFIGPPASAIRSMGSKQRARALMQDANVPVVPGGDARTLEEARATAQRVGYPVLVKATDGGGGKGMRRVESELELPSALERTRSEASKAFGSDAVYIEKAIPNARHVEIQVLGDRFGKVVHLFERDCSIQRRHQKVVEETPCPVIDATTLAAMGEVAVRAAESIGYYSAGTFEFLLGSDKSFYFLEMNTRLQVEHPITELVTGIDLVREMLAVAAGLPLSIEPIVRRGVAIEARLCAEDPEANFLPSPGRITQFRLASGPWVRSDSGVEAGTLVSPDYDPLLAKLSVWAEDRPTAIRRMRRALSECAISGIRNNVGFLLRLFENSSFDRGEYSTQFLDEHRQALLTPFEVTPDEREALVAAVAVLTHHRSRTAPIHSGRPTDGVSPWVQAHRARLRD